MSKIATWLTENSAHYQELSIAWRIDLDVLRLVTDADLNQLGVLLADCKRILLASAQLPGGPRSRRQVTVVIANLVRVHRHDPGTGRRSNAR